MSRVLFSVADESAFDVNYQFWDDNAVTWTKGDPSFGFHHMERDWSIEGGEVTVKSKRHRLFGTIHHTQSCSFDQRLLKDAYQAYLSKVMFDE